MRTVVVFIAGLVSAPLLFVLTAMAGLIPSNATSPPPKWENSIGMRALDTSLERRAGNLKNPIAPNDTAALAAGRKVYAMNCSGCHGTAQRPSDWGTKGFYPRVPQFWQEPSDLTPEEAYAAIHDGVRYSGMGAWRDLMKEEDMWKVANFVATMNKARSTANAAR